MLNKLYKLPEICFVGGSSEDFQFNLFYDESNPRPFSLFGGEAQFSIINFMNKNGSPTSKGMELDYTEDIANRDNIERSIGAKIIDRGSVSTQDELPEDARVGDLYTVLEDNNTLYLYWDGSKWVNGSMEKFYNILRVSLDPDDTVNLFGKYVYQITMRDIDGNIDIPHQGIINIHNNIDKEFTKQQ